MTPEKICVYPRSSAVKNKPPCDIDFPMLNHSYYLNKTRSKIMSDKPKVLYICETKFYELPTVDRLSLKYDVHLIGGGGGQEIGLLKP